MEVYIKLPEEILDEIIIQSCNILCSFPNLRVNKRITDVINNICLNKQGKQIENLTIRDAIQLQRMDIENCLKCDICNRNGLLKKINAYFRICAFGCSQYCENRSCNQFGIPNFQNFNKQLRKTCYDCGNESYQTSILGSTPPCKLGTNVPEYAKCEKQIDIDKFELKSHSCITCKNTFIQFNNEDYEDYEDYDEY